MPLSPNAAAVSTALALLTALTACGSGQDAGAAGGPANGAAGKAGHSAQSALPSAHVHGVDADPGDGAVLLGTHEGLFRYGEDGQERVGEALDLMGFTVAGPGRPARRLRVREGRGRTGRRAASA